MGNGMNKVLPGLYVGNYQDSKDADQLERFEITHILAIHDTARRLHSDKHYLCILAADSPDQNLSQYFSLCNDFIHAARLRGGNVLIHCLAGMSRSVTVAVAYIMSTTSLSWKEALKVVRVGRSIANPNVGFQQQLKDFESSRLQDERNRLKERFPSLALTESDAEACRSTLRNYETLALAKEVCEGKCAMGRTCPTGLCRQATKRTLRRKSSTSSIGSVSSGRTPPQTPRMLPSAPPSPALHRSSSVMSTSRPRSGPAGLHSYTGGSAPPSRAVSRVDLSAAVACSSSNTSLSAIGRSSAFSSSNWRLTAGSAPNKPRPTPPVSPNTWERNRLKERFPSLALTESDAEACRSTLRNYETLALAKEVCEGKCAMGRTCPTGLCRQATKRTLRRKSSTSSIGSVSSGRTPPQTPRMLPSAPPSPALHRSSSVMSTSRPRSGPAGLHSYTGGSAPPSRAVSRVDLSAAVACSSSNTSLSAIGRSSAFSSSNWRLTAGSAPNTPRPTPPVSPQRWPRRLSNRQTPQLPAPPESHPSTMT
ncbi:PREDICTED: sialidase [Acromyrmex echinatior]|uniref:sialidase n=1 Tax=Acromyrmex echinatior TaxID=103372 RepID=UPI0005810C89|nr:PREDICTED: sialidase [Acromyrmex echinatior]